MNTWDYSYADAKEKFAEYISIHGIKRKDVDCYIRKYPLSTFKFYYDWNWIMYLHKENENYSGMQFCNFSKIEC